MEVKIDCAICKTQTYERFHSLFCGHGFHKSCVSEWFKVSRTCPYCRKSEPIITFCKMPEEMKIHAISFITETLDIQNDIEGLFKVARTIKQEFDKKYGKFWHCIIGGQNNMEIIIDSIHSICFEYKEDFHVLLFKA